MRRLILGTAGHIDHGKTALVRALTGIDTDRLPEEKRRGITIDLGFANLRLDSGDEIGIVDVPGHEAFVRNMLAGATGIDLGLLVVAADEGVMPQTREHHTILALLGVRGLVVALTKADLVDAEWLELVAADVRALLGAGPFSASPLVPVSARTGQGQAALLQTLARAAAAVVTRNEADLFRLPIDRVFTVHGTGTVVTGTIWSGAVERDHTLRVLPADGTVRVRGLQSHGEERTRAGAGQRAALALAGTTRSVLTRGDVLVEGEGWTTASILTVRLAVPDSGLPLRAGQRVHFHIGTAEAIGRIVPFDAGAIEPGQEAWAQVRLDSSVVARAGDRFVLRSWSPVTTIAGGQVAEPAAPKRKRPDTRTRDALTAVLTAGPGGAVAGATALAAWRGVPTARLPIVTPYPPHEAGPALESEGAHAARVGNVAYSTAVFATARTAIMEAVSAHHSRHPLSPGVTREELRQLLPAGGTYLADAVIQALAAEGSLAVEGSHARQAGFSPRLSPDQESAAARLLETLRAGGLAAPAADELPADLAGRPDLADILHHLGRTGSLVAVAPGRFLDPDALDQAIRLARRQLAGRTDLGPAEFRDLFGLTRKYLIPLLEYFDRTGITTRRGEKRALPAAPGEPADGSGAASAEMH